MGYIILLGANKRHSSPLSSTSSSLPFVSYIYQAHCITASISLTLFPADYACILTAIILLATYVYSLKSEPRHHRNARRYRAIRTAFLLIVIVVNIFFRLFYKYYNVPFDCSTSDMFAFSMVALTVVLIESRMTVAWGSLDRLGGTEAAGVDNVMILIPKQPQGYDNPQLEQHQQLKLMGHQNQRGKIDDDAPPSQQQFPGTFVSQAAQYEILRQQHQQELQIQQQQA